MYIAKFHNKTITENCILSFCSPASIPAPGHLSLTAEMYNPIAPFFEHIANDLKP
jgi:hypothetical protein